MPKINKAKCDGCGEEGELDEFWSSVIFQSVDTEEEFTYCRGCSPKILESLRSKRIVKGD
jgi:hypothetical protein